MDFIKNEHKILKFWEKNKIFEKLQEKLKGKKPWSFLDGPITANNPMGVHHAWGRALKDLFQRYKAMQGFDQRFQNGFDCQGLWVEVEVEKELGFKNKKDIEDYGIAKFVNKCKARVRKYSKIQTAQSIRLGQWMDWGDWQKGLGNSYYTMSDENNYAIWHFLKKCWQKGWLYKGRDSVPWCPRCGTAISQHEILSEEYQQLTHKAVFVKYRLSFPRKRESMTWIPDQARNDIYFLVWTTTPWTLPGNVALAVNPNLDYVIVRPSKKLLPERPRAQARGSRRHDTDISENLPLRQAQGVNFLILAEDRLEVLAKGYKIVKTIKGKDLVGLEYQGLFDQLSGVKKALGKYKHRVVLWKEVSQEEGTGIVHIAPGCGQEDFQLSKEHKLPVIDLSDDESKYRPGFGQLTGQFVGSPKVRDWIFDNLKQKGSLFKIANYRHRYPTCWRCQSELIWRVVDEWYIAMNDLRQPMMAASRKIKWLPEFGLDRELDWLKNMQDWLISKKRYWGLALPIYQCHKCSSFEVMGSRQELKKRAVSGWQNFEGHTPHRPWIDKVKIECKKCHQQVSRIADVGNPWLDAGIVTYSTIKYFSDKNYWQKWFPADLICESFPGQFRNWFYSLIAMSVVLENQPPTKTIFGYALVRDAKGEEMHKSKGNAIWLDEAAEKMGVDVMRWIYCRQNPALNLNFGYGLAKETKQKLMTLWNIWRFYDDYKNVEERQRSTKNILDKWILARLHQTIVEATQKLDRLNPSGAVYCLENFLDDLSNWYVRLTRKSFNPQVYGQVLESFVRLLAPFIPFLSEEIYQNLMGVRTPQCHSREGGNPEYGFRNKCGMTTSVHLTDWPKPNKKLINKTVLSQMQKTREYVEIVRSLRTEKGIKMRQPLAQVVLAKPLAQEYQQILAEEANVKSVGTRPRVKARGRRSAFLPSGKDWLTKKDILALDIRLTPALKLAGARRELVRQINDLRKQAGLKITDKAVLIYKSVGTGRDLSLQKIFDFKAKDYQDYHLLTTKIKPVETIHELSLRKKKPLAEKTITINGQKVVLKIYKNNIVGV